MGHPGVALRDLEASRDALSRGRYQPQPTERRLSCSHRVTFLTGANRDFPNWRRHTRATHARAWHAFRADHGIYEVRFCPKKQKLTAAGGTSEKCQERTYPTLSELTNLDALESAAGGGRCRARRCREPQLLPGKY